MEEKSHRGTTPDRTRSHVRTASSYGSWVYSTNLAVNGTFVIPLNERWDNSSIRLQATDEDPPLSKIHAALWADPESNVLYRWGGERPFKERAEEEDRNLLQFTPDDEGGGTWSTVEPEDQDEFDDIYQALAGGSAVCGGYGIVVGGLVNECSDWRIDTSNPIRGMATYEFATKTWANRSIADISPEYGTAWFGQSVCATGFPTNALLVTLGGNEGATSYLSSRTQRKFEDIQFYDPVEDKWYTYTSPSTVVPPPRDFYCAVGARSKNSYEMCVALDTAKEPSS